MHLTQKVQRILIVDDDPVMRDLLQALLTLEGYTVYTAESGTEAVFLLKDDHGLNLILTDVQMHGLQGRALAEALREAMPKEALLLGMSGSEPPKEARNAFDSFLLKPFDLQLLRHAIENARSRKAARDISLETKRDSHLTLTHDAVAPLDSKIFGSLTSMISAAQVRELFAMALKDIEKRHMRMVTAAAEHDLSEVKREAHAVKGSCGMIGAAELQSLASAIEDGTTLNTSAVEEIPRACLRLQRMLDSKLHTV